MNHGMTLSFSTWKGQIFFNTVINVGNYLVLTSPRYGFMLKGIMKKVYRLRLTTADKRSWLVKCRDLFYDLVCPVQGTWLGNEGRGERGADSYRKAACWARACLSPFLVSHLKLEYKFHWISVSHQNFLFYH